MLFAVSKLQADRVNLVMNDFAAGLPSPLALLGLAAAMAPALGALRWGIGVLVVLHQVHVSTGRTKAEMAPKGGRFAPVEIVEDLTGSVCLSLLLDVPGCESESVVKAALRGRRIAGGTISNDRFDVKLVGYDGRALAELRRGYAVVSPEAAERRIVASGQIEALARVADVLYPATREPGSGWLVPVAVGHRLLEDPATVPKRQNTRDPDVPHVFTEPVVGVAELVSVRHPRWCRLDAAGLDAMLWRWHAEGEWIVGHRDYHPDHLPNDEQEHAHG